MIYHIAVRDEWDPHATHYMPRGPDEFVHCSTEQQVITVADDLYRGRDDLVLVAIDPEALDARLVWEDCYETGQDFPHVYGAINTGAVVWARPFRCRADGTFQMPSS